MQTLKRSLRVLLPLLVILMGASNAFAVPSSAVVGQWNVIFYLEPGLSTGATQGICFSSDGTWVSTTVAGWNGDWFLKGDRFRWYGDVGSLATGEFGQFISNTQSAGEFAHWRVPGTPPVTSSRGNWRATKISSTCAAPAGAKAVESSDDPAVP